MAADVPIDGVVRNNWKALNHIHYEIAVLQALRERLRCKEIWVAGADRYRNPDADLPADFDAKQPEYYQGLKRPRDADAFVAQLQQSPWDAACPARPLLKSRGN